MTRVLVTARLAPGTVETARMLAAAGPPFDPAAAGFVRHSVFVGGDYVAFLFEGRDADASVQQLAGEVAVWQAGLAWRGLLAAEPTIAHEAYSWREPPRRPLHVPGF
jgi:hypothetical protein